MNSTIEAILEKDRLPVNISRGLISGILGGIAGTLVKSAIEKILPVRKPDTSSAHLKMMDDLSVQVTGERISESNRQLTAELIHIPFGAGLGATYGYAKRDDYSANLTEGALFGASTWVGTHETSLPMLGLKENPQDIPLKLQLNELLAHIAFGVTTEIVRSAVARRLRD